MTTRITLDTNIFLHFKKLEHIEWEKLVDGDSIELVILPVLVRELEKHKVEHKLKSIRQRAARQISWLSKILDEQISPQIRKSTTVIFEHHDPALDFKEYRLNPAIEDDLFIAGAIEQHLESGQPVIVTTNDLGLKLKVKAYEGLDALILPDEYRLENAPDSEEKKRQAMQKELNQLRNRVPKLELGFPNGTSKMSFVVKGLSELSVDVDEAVRKEMRAHPQISNTRPTGTPGVEIFVGRAGAEIAMERYNEELTDYYAECREYYEELEDYQRRVNTQFVASIQLDNIGSQPATEIDIKLQFPTDLRVLFSDSPTPRPKKPEAPEMPDLSRPSWLFDVVTPPSSLFPMTAMPSVNPEFFRGPQEKGPHFDRQARSLSYWKKDLKHHHSYQSEPFVLVFPEREAIRNFKCEYIVTLNEAPEPVCGELHFVFDMR